MRSSGGVPLAKEVRKRGRTTNRQSEPSHVRGEEAVTLGSDEAAPDELVSGPSRVDQVPVTVDTEKLEGRVGRPGLPGLPVTDGPEADLQEVGSLLAIEAGEDASVPELLR